MQLKRLIAPFLATKRTFTKPNSIRCYEDALRRILDFYGDRDVDFLSDADLESYVQKRRKTVRDTSINRDLRVLKALFRFSVERGLIAREPFRVKLLRVGKKVPRILSRPEVQALLGSAPDAQLRTILLAALSTGMRHDELVHANVGDVDFAAGVVRVSQKEGWTPKAYHEREIPMTEGLRVALKEHVSTLANQTPIAPLFQGKRGKRLLNFFGPVRETFKRAGLYSIDAKSGLHQLRRTAASYMLQAGCDIETLRALFGWSELSTAQRYLSSTEDSRKAAVKALNF